MGWEKTMSGRSWAADLDTLTPVHGWVFVGVIEWSSESAEEPAVALRHSVEDIERWYRDTITDLRELDEDMPPPPDADASHDEIVEWMEEWRESTTDAWLTIYRFEIPGPVTA